MRRTCLAAAFLIAVSFVASEQITASVQTMEEEIAMEHQRHTENDVVYFIHFLYRAQV